MSTDHNRIKVADLEKNEPNKTLITNENGELEFSDITGGVQDLQSVLINGNIAYGSRASGGASTLLMNPDAQNSYSNNFFIFRGTTDSNIYQDPLQIYIDNRNTIGGSRIRTSTTGIEISQELTDIGKTTVKISNPIANTTINFPAKPEGTYTLATTEDIGGSQDDMTMQKLIETSTDVDNRTAYYDSGATFAGQRAIGFKGSTEDGTKLSSELGIDHIYMISTLGTTTDYITTNYGAYALGKSINGGANWNTALRYDGIYFQDNDATQNLSILFPKLRVGEPLAIKTMPLSVNGEFADDNGNITISGGGSQNLQSVLDNGKDASIDGGNSTIGFFGDESIENERYIDMSIGNGTDATSMGLSNTSVSMYGGNNTDGRTGYFQVNSGKVLVVEQDNVSGGASSFNLPLNPTNYVDFRLPTLTEDGEKILPVSVNGNFADVNGNIEISGGGSQDLQSVIENGSFATLSSGGQVTFEDPDTFNQTKISGDRIEIKIDDNGDSVGLSPNALSFTKSDNYVLYNRDGIKYTNDDGGLVQLEFGEIIQDNNITLKIPSNLTTGTYTFATLEEISDNFVHKTGEVTEIIDGNKIFRSTIEINGEDDEVSTLVSSGGIIYSEHGYPSLRLAPNHLEEGLDTSSLVKIPRKSGTLVMSVNGEVADESGNVVIAGGSQDFQQTLDNGSTVTVSGDVVINSSNVKLTGNGGTNVVETSDINGTLNIVSGGDIAITGTGWTNVTSENFVVSTNDFTQIQARVINLTDYSKGLGSGQTSRILLDNGTIDIESANGEDINLVGNRVHIKSNQYTWFESPVLFNSEIVLPKATVANLPLSPSIGSCMIALDVTSPTYLQPVVGGGTVVCPVFYNGTSWVAH